MKSRELPHCVLGSAVVAVEGVERERVLEVLRSEFESVSPTQLYIYEVKLPKLFHKRSC